MTARIDKRKNSDLRRIKVTRGYLDYPAGSVLIECGNTKVIVTAIIEDGVPPHQKGKGEGWLTAEYNMLPGSSNERIKRERFKVSGRTMEIQRLIGRALRMAVDLSALGERTITIDADVIQADGGTRTASITGAYIALRDAINKLIKAGKLISSPLREQIAAVSVGIVKGQAMLDLCYEEDSGADADMNIIMTKSGKIVEIQGTAEKQAFDKKEFDALYQLAEKGLKEIFIVQDRA
ncbi:MAG: ribonuclease PH [Candidatus Margulisbacteria bacterium]|nr:ribonuclease PH [Candidatus Margulisiibacteriota bacterium]